MSAPRRLAVVVVPDFVPTVGGTARQATLQARGLAELGYDVVVVTRRYDRSWPAREQVGGLPVRRFGLPGRSGLAEKLSLLALTAWFMRHRSRIALAQTIMYSDFALAAAAAGLRRRVAVVWAAHGEATDVIGHADDLARGAQRRLRRAVLAGCHQVALTDAIRGELVDNGLAEASTAVIPVPVDALTYRPPTTEEKAAARAGLGLAGEDGPVIAFTGRFVATKGVPRLIEAFSRLHDVFPAARLLLVGGGSAAEEAVVAAETARWGLGPAVTVTGFVAEVGRYLWAADVFVLPSVREGLSNSLVEAMATGLPCVAAAEAGGDQVLYDGAGLIPPSSDVAALQDALVQLAEDPALRRRLGAAAVERTRAFTPERVAARYEELVLPLPQRLHP